MLFSGVVSRKTETPLRSRRQSESASTNNLGWVLGRWLSYIHAYGLFRNIRLRVHKFSFEWDLGIHLLICISSLIPFFFTGKREWGIFPIGVWLFYNVIFIFGSRWISDFIPGLSTLNLTKFRRSFKAAVEEFFSPRLLPVLSISFLLVPLSLTVTGRVLSGPPLCFQPCGVCLSHWSAAQQVPYAVLSQYLTKDAFAEIGINSNHYNASGYNFEQSSGRQIVMGDFLPDDTELGHELILRLKKEYPLYGCGYANGQELLAFYTMVQTSFLLFLCVTVAMTICMAWQVAESEVKERKDAEAWLRDDNPMAFSLRRDIIRKFGDPVNSSVRPEASLSWVTFGFVAALTFILLGCGKWSLIPHSNSSTLLVVLNVMSIVLSALILHLGFFGRLLTLYSRNLRRVEFLSFLLEKNSDNDNYITSTSGSVSVAGSGAGTPQRQSSSELGTPALGTHASGQSLNANLQAASDRLASNMEDGLLPGQSQGSIHNNVNINNIDAWWACRNFVLNNDLSIEYDMGGLAMAMTFQLDIIMFSVVCYQTYHEGFNALLGAPGSYCAYACMYITTCLVKIFTLATQTFEEQDRHCRILSAISNRLLTKEQGMGGGGGLGGSFYGTTSDHEAHLTSDTNRIRATASDYINDYNEQLLNHDGYLSDGNGYGRGNVDEFGIMLLGGSGDDFDDGHGLNMDDTDEDEETPMLPAASVGARSGAGTPKLENRSDANTSDKIGVPLRPTGTVITSVVPPASRDKYNNPYYFSMNSPSLEHNEHVGLSISAPPSPSLSSEGKGLSNRGGGIACSDAGTGCKDDSSSQGEGPLPIPTPIVVPPPPQLKHTTSFGNRENAALGGSKTKPILARATSTQQSSLESKRQTLMDIINQIKKYDPYPCILGIPVMPAIFNVAKYYVFFSFLLVGMRCVLAALRIAYE